MKTKEFIKRVEDLIKEVYIEPAKIFRLDETAKNKINKNLKGDKNEA